MTQPRSGPSLRPLGRIPLLAAALLLVAAVVFALICRAQSVVTIPGAEVRLGFTNDLAWDPGARRLERTGGDPYAWVKVPGVALPIRRVTVEYGGAADPVEGHFYIFRSTSTPVHLGLTMVDGRVTPLAGGLRVEADLDDSNCLRLDLPDFLKRPLELRRIVIDTPFVSPWRWSFLLMALCATAAVVVVVWTWLRRWRWGEWVLIALLVAGKLWLAGDLGLTVYGNAMHDDGLFATQAHSIMEGRWLGDYGEVTLSKGPVYPLFLAAVGRAGVPLQQAQAALHAVACLVFVFALRPLVPRAGARVLLFAVLLFDPQMLSAAAVGRVLRTGIQPALVLLALGGAIGLAVRMRRGPAARAGWAALTGVAWAAFWYSREEGVWLVPSAVLVLGAAAIGVWRDREQRRWRRLAVLLSPLLAVGCASGALRLVNNHFYGAPVAVEFTSGSFPAAYGALMRILPSVRDPLVQVPRETRERAYVASPAFAQLRPWLDGEYGGGWVNYGWEGIDRPEAQRDIRAGWLPWALRGAAAAAGHYGDPKAAEAYWRRVATELNDACDKGRLAAVGRRSGFAPLWHRTMAGPLWRAFCSAADLVVSARGARVWRDPSSGSPEQLALFATVTHEEPAGSPKPRTLRGAVREVLFRWQSVAGWWATVVAALAVLVVCGRGALRRDCGLEAAVLLALGGGAVALMLIVALIDVTAFSSVVGAYLAPAAPLVLALWVLAPLWALPGGGARAGSTNAAGLRSVGPRQS